jgi:hypothetical protein
MPYRIAILEAGDADPDGVPTIMDTDPGARAGVFFDQRIPATGSQEPRWHDGGR